MQLEKNLLRKRKKKSQLSYSAGYIIYVIKV
jgi:hypothetical protein